MKHLSVKNLLWTNLTIKLFSLLFGLGLWSLLSQTQIYDISYNVPICCFGNSKKSIITPDMVHITLRGPRNAFSKLNNETLAIHINTDSLNEGKNSTTISQKDLFLPSDINMLNCNPRIAEIIVNPTKEA